MRLAAALLLAAVASLPGPAAGAPGESDLELFRGAVTSLEKGALDEAIDRLELLSDRGFLHPDASYDRAVAYTRRASTPAARRGDLGRAAAALTETLALRPDDADAAVALERLRREISRRRARSGATLVELSPSLGWAVVGLVAEHSWASLALAGSVATAVGLALRLFSRHRRVRLGGVVAASVGGVVLAVTGTMAALARHERLYRTPAVVIVEEARLLDDEGVAMSGPGSVVPEGAELAVVGRRGTLAQVEWGTLEGWLSLGQLRLVPRTRGTM